MIITIEELINKLSQFDKKLQVELSVVASNGSTIIATDNSIEDIILIKDKNGDKVFICGDEINE